jgi:hypothetical protein
MDEVKPVDERNSFLRNDRLLTCSMLVVYGLCILGLVAGTIWGLDRRSKKISADATSTAFAYATQQAKATATAAARSTAQAQYSFIEPFDNNSRGWFVKTVNDDLIAGSIAIDGGLYVWNIGEVKQPFTYWVDFPLGNSFKDFDTYVDFKIIDTAPEGVCAGFLFRMASSDWEQGTYTFCVCHNSRFYVSYYKQGKWEMISDWEHSDSIRKLNWNRIEINARDDHFVFIINNEIVDEITDDRQPQGALALFIAANENKPATIQFDNFGFQSR